MWTLTFLGKLQPLLPLLLRAFVGISFAFFHGYGKIVGPEGFDGGAAFVQKAAGAAPAPLLYLAAWTEFLAGLGLLSGLLTRWSSLGILAVMSYAIFGIHWKDGFAAPKGYQMAAAYAVLSLCIAALGPGSVSLDRLFFRKAALNQ